MLIEMPGSKSYTNRALILAALTQGAVVLKNPLYSDDTEAMIGCLRALGLHIETKTDRIIVHSDISSIQEKTYRLFARDSGTTVRFLLALLCIVPGVKILEGSERLNQRPIGDLVDGLRAMGAQIVYCEEEGKLPLRIESSVLLGDTVHLKSDLSSQFCSALLMIAPMLSQGVTLYLEGELISKPYVDMTIGAMREWGIEEIVNRGKGFFIRKGQRYSKEEYSIEGDYSSAGYFFALAALAESTLTVTNLNPSSLQADRKFLHLLAEMGNRVVYGENRVSVAGKGVAPLDVNMEDCPDQVMTLAVLAAFAQGTTTIRGVRSLRVKETERVFALRRELGKMGIETADTHDTLTIYGGNPQPAVIETYNDHRMAMAFAIARRKLPDLVIEHPEVVKKTFPTFWDVLKGVLK